MTRQDDIAPLAVRLHSLSIRLLRLVREEDRKSGIGPAQLSALSVLAFAGPMTLAALARAEHVAPPTISRITAALSQAKLIRLTADPEDGRAKRAALTAKGRRLFDVARRRRLRVVEDIVASLDSGDRNRLAPMLDLLVEAVANRIRH